jgi:predicted PurR-regulated permease PerM
MARTQAHESPSRFIMLATFCLVVTALYFGQQVLMPLALAVLFTFLLTPVVARVERLGIWRGVAASAVVLLALCLIGFLAWTLSSQALDLASELPHYKKNISEKIAHLPFLHRDGGLAKLNTIENDFKSALAVGGETTKPIPVTIADRSPLAMSEITSLLGEIASPLAMTFIVAVFVIFMLVRREDLRDRLIRLVGEGQLDVTTQALSEAGNRISRYLLMQSLVNTGYGIVIASGLWAIGHFSGEKAGFPDAPLWGLLCGLFRFIPYVGPWLGAFFPVILSVAAFPGLKEFVETVCLFVGIETLNNSGIEPMLYGSTTGLSAVAILAAAVFWGWLWGPIGLLLSTPLTACVVVIGKYVPQMEFLDVLLGDEPPLPPPTRLYQRLLALDSEAASDVIDEYRKAMPLEELYDTVIVPALAMAEKDRHLNRLEEGRYGKLLQSVRDAIDELGDRERTLAVNNDARAVEQAAKADALPTAPAVAARPQLPKECTVTVLCLPAHNESDELVAVMMSQLLEFRGYCAVSMTQDALASEMVEEAARKSPNCILVSALPPAAVTHARYLCKRLQSKFPSIAIVVGLWIFEGDLARAQERISPAGGLQISSSLRDSLERLHQLAQASMLAGTNPSIEKSPTAVENGVTVSAR